MYCHVTSSRLTLQQALHTNWAVPEAVQSLMSLQTYLDEDKWEKLTI